MPSIWIDNVPAKHVFLLDAIGKLVDGLGKLLNLDDPAVDVEIRAFDGCNAEGVRRLTPTGVTRDKQVFVCVDLKERYPDVYREVHSLIQAFLDAEGIGEDAEIYLYPKHRGEYSRGGKVLGF